MSMRHIRLSQQDKDSLIRLKVKTGIQNWNVLCRWALAESLREDSPVTRIDLPADSNVEMAWEVLAGEFADIWLALVRERSLQPGAPLDDEELQQCLRLHLHRGIGYLIGSGNIRNLEALCSRATVTPSDASLGERSPRSDDRVGVLG